MSKFVDDTLGIDGGAFYDPRSGNTTIQSFGPSGCVTIEDQNDYAFGVFDPNSGNAFIRSGDTISGTMRVESVSGELYLSDGFAKNYSLTQPNERELVSGYDNYSIFGNFNEIYAKVESLTLSQSNFKSGSVSGILFYADTDDRNKRKYNVIFDNWYDSSNYSIAVLGPMARTWSYENKTVSGFTINSNAVQSLECLVDWQTQVHGS